MQNDFVNLVNEAIKINSGLLAKATSYGVEASQKLVQQVSDQSADWLKVKNVDDYVANQENWNSFAIDQTQKATRTFIDLGNEAASSYLSLWQKASYPGNGASTPKVVKSKANAA